MLAPLIERELHYRLLSSEHGRLLRQIATADSHLSQISAATDWIREHHAEPMRIEELARSGRGFRGQGPCARVVEGAAGARPLIIRSI